MLIEESECVRCLVAYIVARGCASAKGRKEMCRGRNIRGRGRRWTPRGGREEERDETLTETGKEYVEGEAEGGQ